MKEVGIKYLQGLLINTTNKTAQKVLKEWIGSVRPGARFKKLTPRQGQLLNDIKRGGPVSNMYLSKN
jgi:hypothetical protein